MVIQTNNKPKLQVESILIVISSTKFLTVSSSHLKMRMEQKQLLSRIKSSHQNTFVSNFPVQTLLVIVPKLDSLLKGRIRLSHDTIWKLPFMNSNVLESYISNPFQSQLTQNLLLHVPSHSLRHHSQVKLYQWTPKSIYKPTTRKHYNHNAATGRSFLEIFITSQTDKTEL